MFGKKRLLPSDAYPAGVNRAGRDRVDAHLRAQRQSIPVEPGVYLDREGERWFLDTDGAWTDHKGERRDPAYTPIVSLFGPFTKEG